MAESRRVLHRCSCGASYDADEWDRLPCPGLWHIDTGYTLHLRNCTALSRNGGVCDSTMATLVLPVPLDVFEETQGKDAA